MLEATAGSIGELIQGVRSIANEWSPGVEPQELWFRGQRTGNWALVPGFYRPDVEKLHYDEISVFERFKIFATPYVRRLPTSDWEWYFLAQHHGLPTRLLDWSEGVLPATYFALCDLVYPKGRLAIDEGLLKPKAVPIFDDESPVVWMLDAGTLNQVTAGDDYPYVPGGELTAQYLPENLAQGPSNSNRAPLALLAPRADERITAQQAVFTVHGHAKDPLEALALSSPIRLAKIRLDRANICHLWTDLELAGVTKLALFPGVDTAAEHVKWVMQAAKPIRSHESGG